jgi:hypothetical protein
MFLTSNKIKQYNSFNGLDKQLRDLDRVRGSAFTDVIGDNP